MPTAPTKFDLSKTGYRYLDFDRANNVYHPGIDFNWGSTPRSDLGQDVVAPAGANVVYTSKKGDNGGLGNYVVLYHPSYGVWTRYCHLFTIDTFKGKSLREGEKFATVGGSGGFLPHLHFEVLNSRGVEFVKDHWRQPYNGYFQGQTKEQVAQMTVDPIVWMSQVTNSWQEEAERWAKETGVISSGWEEPTLPMSQERVAAALKKMYEMLSS